MPATATTAREARQRLGELTKQSRDLLEEWKATGTKWEDWDAQKRAQYDRIDSDLDAQHDLITRLDKQEQREGIVSEFDDEPETRAILDDDEYLRQISRRGDEPETDDERRWTSRAMRELAAYDEDDTSNDLKPREVARLREYRAYMYPDRYALRIEDSETVNRRELAFRSFLRYGREEMDIAHKRALSADDAEAGGYTVPASFMAELIKFVDDQLFIRQFGRTFEVSRAESLGFPSLDADPADGTWQGETSSVTFDTTMDFGKRELYPHMTAIGIKVSRKLVRASAIPVDELVRERLAYKLAVTEEKAFMTGAGAQTPLGLFTALADGIPTGRDVSTGNGTSTIGSDNLFETKYNCKSQYWQTGRWIMHRDTFKRVRKLTDANGQYLWQPGLAGGAPGTIVDSPYSISEHAPNTFTSGNYVYLFGDLSFYWIATALNLEIQLLVERFAENHQFAYIARHSVDGMPVLAEAFSRGKLA